ncbi:outer membrane beta-barrel protein [Spirosoma radiotolerans]|uniref:Outer membrane protein beta-barrel domain-containing protein n=1 Tax=Spirosoma radiotolerans TaxID=1379870 RepID=A0A0E3V9E7_9BACT|nr:outer membrane beta-barrel protein [Spirosoma radiotolerans]AKD57076.1 hypothetical protein SD10_21450 [Spirosoma radiotolerans]
MKKLIFSLLLSAAGLASVQAQSNTLLVYGTVNYTTTKVDGTTGNTFSLSPGVGYQWNDNWTGGLNFSVGNAKTGLDKTSSFSVGPFIRYTQPLAGVFAIYGQLNTNYLSGKVANVNYNGFGATLFPAIGVNLKNSFALNFSFGSINFSSQKFDGSSSNATTFGIAFGSGASFGISKNFGLGK